jgi:hypothetical protein
VRWKSEQQRRRRKQKERREGPGGVDRGNRTDKPARKTREKRREIFLRSPTFTHTHWLAVCGFFVVVCRTVDKQKRETAGQSWQQPPTTTRENDKKETNSTLTHTKREKERSEGEPPIQF